MLMMWTLTCWRGLLLIANSIDSGNLEIISMHKEGDGAQKLELFKHPEEKVLHELMSNIRLAGCQHFAFKEYLDPLETDCLPVMQMDQSVFNWLSFI